ncbi:SDR family NAD(P)-dependent oxidoreductase [Mucilaginibacter sp.]|uniref:SDR family NAD(P)-dependent oxidoreductase n=1 Tax=Mucilaginibacter sp. TaxID=1882438 RepID=UPI00283DB9A1|nr:SDR family NAD(P)-dependent oxidoreductase [Mucilaginibacter sp.]MDR3696893.1 SDR family NAD(P)-dependent oxidoreductase [Mucilaginibacter sp.]
MSNHFNNKVTWITGASSGIGEALAYTMSAVGTKLILSGRRMDELERVKQACSDPAEVQLLQLDLADAASLEGKVADAISCFGHIDMMVHNGGITQRGLVVETGMEVHRRIMEVDYFSYVELTRALLPHFVERKAGHFVVTSSVMGKIGTPMRSAYAAAKHALHGFFDCLRAEVAADNIKVTILTPGYIRTNISLFAVTNTPYVLGKPSENIENGLSADRAAVQIMKAIKRGAFEAYIGNFSGERFAIWVMRFAPGVFTRIAPKLVPK